MGRYYSLLQKGQSISTYASRQRAQMLKEIRQNHKETAELESELQEFFYGEVKDEHYNQVMSIAEKEFNKIWANRNFSLDRGTYTAKYNNKANISFANKNSSVEQIKKYAQNLLNSSEVSSDSIREKLNAVLAMGDQEILTTGRASVNAIIFSIIYGNKAIYGDAFEIPLAAFGMMLDNAVEEVSDELIQKYWLARQTSKTQVKISSLGKREQKKLKFSGATQIGENAYLEYRNPTKDKVDVTFTFGDVDYNISAKSYYDLNRFIHILGGTNLTVPLLNLGSVDFVSGYLTSLYYGDTQNLNEIHDVLKITILAFALTGKSQSSKIADTFVLNNKQNKKIYVRSMAEIMNYITSTPGLMEKYVWFTEKSPNIPDSELIGYHKINSNFSVADMLNAMSRKKLSVSIKGTAIRDSKRI